jgi:hypothetical protein
MAPTPSVRIDKAFTYRGAERIFSNRYHFNGGVPADNTHWNTLFDAITAAEKLVFENYVEIRKATAFAAGSELPVHDKTYTLTCTGSFAGSVPVPGDCAALVRYSTTARSSKNHPIYLFNYYHGATLTESNGPDLLNAAQLTALQAYADAWLAGFSDGTITAVRAGPNGATATSRLVSANIHHRDFPA